VIRWGEVWPPSLDVPETKNDLIIRTKIAGVDPKDVENKTLNSLLERTTIVKVDKQGES
jgi:HSP20 family molecular chaperone IbpA